MLEKLLRKVGTPLPMALFFVVATSGLMMFFHLGDAWVKGLHEWLSVAFVAGAVLHIVRNRKAFFGYFRTRSFWIAGTLTSVVAITLIATTALGKRPERRQNPLTRVAEQAAIADLAPVLHTTPPALVERLKSRGLTVPSERASLSDVAKASKREPGEVLDITFGPGSGEQRRRSRGPRG